MDNRGQRVISSARMGDMHVCPLPVLEPVIMIRAGLHRGRRAGDPRHRRRRGGGLDEQLKHHERLDAARQNFVLGNVKARLRMVAQYAIANARGGLVIGTDHAAEAVMGFFTQFGDGARASGPQAADRRSRGAAPGQAGRGRAWRFLRRHQCLPARPGGEAACQRIVRAYEATRHKRDLPLVPCP